MRKLIALTVVALAVAAPSAAFASHGHSGSYVRQSNSSTQKASVDQSTDSVTVAKAKGKNVDPTTAVSLNVNASDINQGALQGNFNG